MKIKWMRNSIVYPLGISITYAQPRMVIVPNSISIGFFFVSLCIWQVEKGK